MAIASSDQAFGVFCIEYGSHSDDNLSYPLACSVDYVKYVGETSLNAFFNSGFLILEPRKMITSSSSETTGSSFTTTNDAIVVRPRIRLRVISDDSQIQDLFSGFISSCHDITIDEVINSTTGYENYITKEFKDDDKLQMSDINLKYSSCHVIFSMVSDDGTNPLKKLKTYTLKDTESKQAAAPVSSSDPVSPSVPLSVPQSISPSESLSVPQPVSSLAPKTPPESSTGSTKKVSSSKRRSLRRKKLMESRRTF